MTVGGKSEDRLVVALYRFVSLEDYEQLKAPLQGV